MTQIKFILECSLKKIRIIAVGKLKNVFFKQAAEHYSARIKHHWQLEEINPRDAEAALPTAEAIKQEGVAILNSLRPNDIPICLDERGKEFSSREFADFLNNISENQAFYPTFIVGGAFGLSEEVKKKAKHKIALSRMTFPHELARVLLLEQLYRADAILRNSPYHH